MNPKNVIHKVIRVTIKRGSLKNHFKGFFKYVIVVPPQFQFEEPLKDTPGTFYF
jgi:hypothetical protein